MMRDEINKIKERHKPGNIIHYSSPHEVIGLFRKDVDYLLSLVERYKEALEFYASCGVNVNNADWDIGEHAREVLKSLPQAIGTTE